MRNLSLYYSKKSSPVPLVDDIKKLSESLGLTFVDINIDGDADLEERFGSYVPVVLVGPYRLNYPFTLSEVEVAIKSTLYQDEMDPEGVIEKRKFTFTRQEKFTLWFARAYVWIIPMILLIFVGFSFLPPVLEMNGQIKTAQVIYNLYSHFCHQLAFRSYFINGEQLVYPRALAGIKNLRTYEDVTGMPAENIKYAREFIGNQVLGFKIALCQRDLPIYTSLAFFGLIFALTKRKIKPIHWYWWIIIGIVPIALDGLSQLPGFVPGWPAWLPIRESTPALRTITGILFGAGTGWYMYPLMEDSVKEARFALERKRNIVKRITGN